MDIIILAVLNVCLLGLLAWKEVNSNKLIRDLTNKVMAKDTYEYQMINENKPEKIVKEKKAVISDPVLGDNY